MSAPAVPTACATALKEWASVLTALERGQQFVLIRKGGLIEPGSSFELVSNAFILYPTYEHQTINYVREPFRAGFEQALADRSDPQHLRLRLFGLAVSAVQVREPALIERLSPFHIYNDAFLSQRLKWQPEQPLVVVLVRVFRLAEPYQLTVEGRYAGCKSWVDLAQPVPLAGAAPVLDEPAFQERARAVAAILSA